MVRRANTTAIAATSEGTDAAMHRSLLPVYLVVLLLAAGLSPALAQGPEVFAAPHIFSLPMTTSVRAFGMGYQQAAVADDGFANPAYAGMLTRANAQVRAGTVSFERGPSLTMEMASVAFPLDSNRPELGGFQVATYHTRSSTYRVAIPGAPPPFNFSMGEENLGIMYGRPVSERLLVGVGITPLLKSRARLSDPASGTPFMFVDGRGKLGGRVGLAYKASDKVSLGALYDNYRTNVDMMGAFIHPSPMSLRAHSENWAVGGTYQVDAQTAVALEATRYENLIGPSRVHHGSLHIGAERIIQNDWALRAGANDGNLTVGAGWRSGDRRWRADYAYMVNWGGFELGPLFGSSKSHMLVAEYYW